MADQRQPTWHSKGLPHTDSSGKRVFDDRNPLDMWLVMLAKYGRPRMRQKDWGRGGKAKWLARGDRRMLYKSIKDQPLLAYYKIVVRDMAQIHLEPVAHADFLEHWVRVAFSNLGAYVLARFSNSALSKYQKQLLGAQCHFEGANIATICLWLRLCERFPELRSERESRKNFDKSHNALWYAAEYIRLENMPASDDPIRDLYNMAIFPAVGILQAFNSEKWRLSKVYLDACARFINNYMVKFEAVRKDNLHLFEEHEGR